MKKNESVEKLEIGKDYISVLYSKFIVIDRAGDFDNKGFYEDLYKKDIPCSNYGEWIKATEADVIEAFEKHLVHRYGKDWETMKIKEKHPDSNRDINGSSYEMLILKLRHNGWIVYNQNGMLYCNGVWVERLEEEEKNKIMKKFRLKQWYPRIPVYLEDGYVISFDDDKGIAIYEFANGVVDTFEMSGAELECTQYWELIEDEEPLFITEDGVMVHDDDTLVFVVKDDFKKSQRFALAFSLNKSTMKSFFHESNADEYILWNKPLFSLLEIDITIEMYTHELEELIELAKEKIEG